MGFSNINNIVTEVKKRGRKPKNTLKLEVAKSENVEIQNISTLMIKDSIDTWVGKWVCFMQNGSPVIGRVLYTGKTILGKIELYTSIGMTNAENVLESR